MATVFAETQVVRKFTDISLTFNTNPFTKDVVTKVNEDAIKQALMSLLRTKKYERPFHPEIAADIDSLLFENYTPITHQVLKRTIEDVIKYFEPRAKLIDLSIAGDPYRIDLNQMWVKVTFTIMNSTMPATVSVQITRAR
jgi:phage baseplate assembly protein W